jgi:hypothetical protein
MFYLSVKFFKETTHATLLLVLFHRVGLASVDCE